ncbi:MAG: MoxR family ATPase [Deltaproteobacteria bacterium]|nr:MAG: MoxR family ATPase [Deltaproteobacteria bacterium]
MAEKPNPEAWDRHARREEDDVIQAVSTEESAACIARIEELVTRISGVIIGKEETIRLVVTALCARGHLLLEDIPGVGKTTLARTLARSLDLSFQRIQFTPDLLPSDVFGVSIYDPQAHAFEFKPGPIFSNVILADEINRATPRTQSALLEAMNEFQVTVDRQTYALPQPFIVLATQNPVEFKGTYPLPESQLDRFLMKIHIGYPTLADEKRIILGRTRSDPLDSVTPLLGAEEVLALQEATRKVRIAEELLDYLLAIVQATRESAHLKSGVSPRGTLAFTRAVQAYALVSGRDFVLPDDVKALAAPVLAHRLIPRIHWKEGWHAEDLIAEIVASIPVPL